MALVKWKIDENWDGIVLHNTVSYVPGDIFEADESLGKNRPWLILQKEDAKVSEKAKDEKTTKDTNKREVNKRAEEAAIKDIVKKKIAKQEVKKEAKNVK
jgi:hypothetical protein